MLLLTDHNGLKWNVATTITITTITITTTPPTTNISTITSLTPSPLLTSNKT